MIKDDEEICLDDDLTEIVLNLGIGEIASALINEESEDSFQNDAKIIAPKEVGKPTEPNNNEEIEEAEKLLSTKRTEDEEEDKIETLEDLEVSKTDKEIETKDKSIESQTMTAKESNDLRNVQHKDIILQDEENEENNEDHADKCADIYLAKSVIEVFHKPAKAEKQEIDIKAEVADKIHKPMEKQEGHGNSKMSESQDGGKKQGLIN